MPLDNISLVPGENTHLDVDVVLNEAIDRVNEIDAGLPGGATAEVLKKASNSDYDYEWVPEQDIAGKLDVSSIITESVTATGPTSYSTETTIHTLIPSATLNSAKMKYTFMGYLSNDVEDTASIRIKRAGVEIAITKTTVPIGQINFCLVWIDTYTANQSITATVQMTADGGEIRNSILLCEALDAI